MLVHFSAKNFKSFKDQVNLSVIVSSLKEHYEIPAQAFIQQDNFGKISPVVAIYGANASGKSNLFEAMTMMKYFVQTSLAKENVVDKIPVESFRLSPATENAPTEFEISYIANGRLFRYGFLATKELVVEEWLYEKELKEWAKEKELFYREKDTLHYHNTLFKVGKLIGDQHLAKDSVLVLTLGYQLNDEIARSAMSWFTGFNTIRGHNDEDFKDFSISQISEKTEIASEMLDLMRYADTGIFELSSGILMNKQEVFAHHMSYDEDGKESGEKWFVMSSQESEGTKKLFNLSGPVLHTLKHGNVLFVDELDAQLHPNLLELLVRMFQDQKINTKGAQLIFTIHNTNLLNAKLLRRDQVWITEKNRFGVTALYSLADYKTGSGKARNTEAIEQNYIDGKYGGVPFLGDFENFLETFSDGQTTKE
jgi:AAA15 family ATPase/GTPase